MLVYKATKADMTCTMGDGTFQYKLNVPAHADSTKCGRRGLHACEYVLDCFRYYSLDDRIFKAEAEGPIDEDGENTRIACEQLTLTEELTRRNIVEHAIIYMARHPDREWEMDLYRIKAQKEKAEGNGAGIVIARGTMPMARGKKGDVLGFIMELEKGWLRAVGCCEIDGRYGKEGVWYSITPDGRLVEVSGDED